MDGAALRKEHRPMMAARLECWNEGGARRALLDFVARVTTMGSPTFVPPAGRIAVFDNDGTLWCEKPMPIETGFQMLDIARQAEADPTLRARQPWKAVADGDHAWLANVITKHYNGDDSDLKLMAAGLLQAYAGDTVQAFAAKAEAYLRGNQNPVLKRPYLKTAYQPMRELLHLLRDSGFTTYIVSGGTRDFMRPITEELYGVPPERVVGTTVALEYREADDGKPGIYHTPKLEVFDDGPTKAVRIWSRIGARPIFAAGNANGDLQMLKITTWRTDAAMALVVDHDDGVREPAYTAGAEKLLRAATENGWTVASVKRNWRTVFVD
jgi:phosphoserine phosphatase